MGIEENKHDKKNLMMISFFNIMFTFQFISLKVFFFFLLQYAFPVLFPAGLCSLQHQDFHMRAHANMGLGVKC